jgi:energy-coupling factor transporter ATP-binding protein EcfA2
MIRNIEIRNFRCFERLTVEDVARVNVIVGDNGSGKTALLEAIFLALCNSPGGAVRIRQWRGMAPMATGTANRIEEALWGSLFRHFDFDRPISVTLSGSGPEARSFFLSHGPQKGLIPLADDAPKAGGNTTFTWRDNEGVLYSHVPEYTAQGIGLDPVIEKLPEFHFYNAGYAPGPSEVADEFTKLSNRFGEEAFLEIFNHEYPWIKGLSVGSVAGQPAVHATVEGSPVKIPLNETSGAINRMVAILLSIAARQRSVVLVDEIENGIYHTHHLPFWRALLNANKLMDSQLFLSTHNEEWLKALAEAGVEYEHEIAFWRMRRNEEGEPCINKLTMSDLREGLEFGLEMR